MKNEKSNLLKALVISVLIFASNLVYSQTCVTCDNTKSNVVAGFNNNVNGSWTNQSILGSGNTTSRNNAVAIGTNSVAAFSHSYVLGSFSASNGMHAYAIGTNSIAQSTSSFAFGNHAKSMFGNSLAIGNFTMSNQVGAYVFGLGKSSELPLTNNTGNSLAIGFNSQTPTLFISETAVGKQSGKVGIGNITDPQAKLHIKADDSESASLLFEGQGFKGQPLASILMTNGRDQLAGMDLTGDRGSSTFSIYNKSDAKGRMVFTSHFYVFSEGLVGIGTNEPRALLDVAGDAMVRSLIINESYSLPSTAGSQSQFLRGDGTWAIPSGGGGGSNYWLPDGENIYFDKNVGIGSTPKEKLTLDSPYGRPIHFHIGGSQGIVSNAYFNGSSNVRSKSGPAYTINFSEDGMAFRAAATGSANSIVSWTEAIVIKTNGNVGIGTTTPDYKLTVAGGIHARDVKVTLSAGADNVFGENYKLAPLSEIEAFVSANKHLPGIEAEKNMLQEGLDLGSFQIKLLAKIEELTLYIIQQQKEIEALKAVMTKP